MNEKIVVPLDGSKRAEAILAHVEPLAQHLESKLVLLRVGYRIDRWVYPLLDEHPGLRLEPAMYPAHGGIDLSRLCQPSLFAQNQRVRAAPIEPLGVFEHRSIPALSNRVENCPHIRLDARKIFIASPAQRTKRVVVAGMTSFVDREHCLVLAGRRAGSTTQPCPLGQKVLRLRRR